ncbi:uncharacterized protein TNCV_601971 [Trichonephila clavipes]|nr:uncharacterized protein TNCV_601971 [Trichonephila clavipes]
MLPFNVQLCVSRRWSDDEYTRQSQNPCSKTRGYGSPMVKVTDHGRHVMSLSAVPLKTRLVGEQCTLNLPRAQTSSRWCGVVVRSGGGQLRCRPRHLIMVQNYEVPRQKPSCI